MRTLLALPLLCLATGPIAAQEPAATNSRNVDRPIRLAQRCALQSERVSGMNRVCYYDCGGVSVATSTLASYSCPYWIDR